MLGGSSTLCTKRYLNIYARANCASHSLNFVNKNKNTCVSDNNPFAGKRMGRHINIKLQVLSTRRGAKRVIAEVVGPLEDEVLLQLPTASAMSQCIRRKRAKVENHPCNPTSLTFDIPPQSTTLANGENCLLYDHGPGAGTFLIFSTQRSQEMLAQSSYY